MTKILNLANSTLVGRNFISYKVSKFPDGQQSIELDVETIPAGETVQIHTRLNSFKDIELVVCAVSALRNNDVDNIELYSPYFLGGRSDRRFSEGGVNYIKDVISPIINSLNFKSVAVIDPHSDVLEACINKFKKIDNVFLVEKVIEYLKLESKDIILVSPDAGAMKKIYNVAESIDAENIIIASKHRDIKTGKITHTDVPSLDTFSSTDNFIIIDDICDGGRTFVEIAKVINAHEWPNGEFFNGQIYLVVTHGIFSAGFEELAKYFSKIFTTDSVCSKDDLDSVLGNEIVKQFTVFHDTFNENFKDEKVY